MRLKTAKNPDTKQSQPYLGFFVCSNTINEENPTNAVKSHIAFPKNDICNTLEYSFFLIINLSINCVPIIPPISAGSLNKISSVNR